MSRYFRSGILVVGIKAAGLKDKSVAIAKHEERIRRLQEVFKVLKLPLSIERVFDIPGTAHPMVLEVLQSSFDTPVHPVFHLDRFIDKERHNGPRIWPALVLASNILSSPEATQFIHAMLYGRRTIEPPKSGMKNEPIVRFWRKVYNSSSTQTYHVPNAEAERVEDVVDEMASKIHFAFWDLGITRGGACTRDGKLIAINVRRLHGLFDLTGYPELVLRKWLNIAVTLLHELMHVLSWTYCIDGAVLTEDMLFEDDAAHSTDEPGEVGWAFERFALGSAQIDETLSDLEMFKLYNKYLP